MISCTSSPPKDMSPSSGSPSSTYSGSSLSSSPQLASASTSGWPSSPLRTSVSVSAVLSGRGAVSERKTMCFGGEADVDDEEEDDDDEEEEDDDDEEEEGDDEEGEGAGTGFLVPNGASFHRGFFFFLGVLRSLPSSSFFF